MLEYSVAIKKEKEKGKEYLRKSRVFKFSKI